MANNIVNLLTSVLIPLALNELRAVAGSIQTITTDISSEEVEKNETLKLQLRNKGFVSKAFNGTAEAQDLISQVKEIVIDKHQHVSFEITDRELVNKNGMLLIQQAIEDAVKALAEKIATDVYNLYKEVYNHVGTGSNNPMKVDDLYDANRKMFNNRVRGQTYTALNALAYADLSKELRLSSNTSDAISEIVTTTGEFRNIAGTNIFRDQLLEPIYHDAGSASAEVDLATSGVTAVDSNTITIAHTNAAGVSYKVGDLIEVNDNSGQQFVVTEDVDNAAAGNLTVKVSPAVKTEIADETSVTVRPSHEVNLTYTRDFAIFVMRSLNKPSEDLGLFNVNSIQDVVVDEVTGIPLRYEAHRIPDNQKLKWTFDILYAVETIDPLYACRVLPS